MENLKVRSANDYFLLERLEQNYESESGLQLPGGGWHTKNLAIVIEGGRDGVIPNGSRVVFAGGKSFQLNGKEMIACEEKEILCIVS